MEVREIPSEGETEDTEKQKSVTESQETEEDMVGQDVQAAETKDTEKQESVTESQETEEDMVGQDVQAAETKDTEKQERVTESQETEEDMVGQDAQAAETENEKTGNETATGEVQMQDNVDDTPSWLRNHEFRVGRSVDVTTLVDHDNRPILNLLGIIPPSQLWNLAQQKVKLLTDTSTYVRIFIHHSAICIDNLIVNRTWNPETASYKCSLTPGGIAVRHTVDGAITRQHRALVTLKTRQR